MTEEQYRELRSLTREHTYAIWQLAKMGAPLEGENAIQARVMLDHPQYYDYWDRIPEMGSEEVLVDGVNPFAHIVSHAVIENQLATGEPPAVARALHRLMRQGLSRHEAIHQIGTVLATEIFEILRDQRPFDEEGYNRAMHRLGREQPRSAQRTRRRKKRR